MTGRNERTSTIDGAMTKSKLSNELYRSERANVDDEVIEHINMPSNANMTKPNSIQSDLSRNDLTTNTFYTKFD